MKRSTCSIRDLAEYVNVSPSTVSRVLNNKKSNVSITEATRRKIMKAAKKLNYTPNIHAKRLFGDKTNIIGLLVPSYERLGMHIFEDNHLVRIISGLEKSLRVNKYNLLLLFNDKDFVPQKRYLQLFREKQIDGLLVWGALEDDDYWDELRDSGFPYLFLVNAPREREKFNHIVVDPYKATCKITDILLDKGHRKIAWIRGRDDIALTRCQARAIDDTLKRAGLSSPCATNTIFF